jgi:hypothetical protein
VSGDGRTPNLGDMDRRALLAALARWTVPTVVTLSLATRTAQAASCPPCTKKQGGGACRACTMNQMLNCQCEPCLGPPYCSSGAVVQPGWAPPSLSQSSGTAPFGGARGPGDDVLNALRRRRTLMQQADPFASPFARPGSSADSIFRPTPRTPYGRSPTASSLYDRLRHPEDR